MKLLLKPLAQLIRKLRGEAAPNVAAYDLTEGQVALLHRLRGQPEWQVYLTLIDNVASYKCESLIYEHDAAKNAFQRGYVAALRELPLLVERMAKQVADARARPAQPDQSARRDAALYGTASWPGRGSPAD